MFKRIISRNSGTPWPSTDMTSEKWLSVPVGEVRISDLIATQDGLYLHALYEAHQTLGIDSYPHVIRWQGEYYLEDGHHRVFRQLMRGRDKILVRILGL